jgi:predicted phosphoribosyltransferase
MSFRDRTDAGKRLARELRGLKDQHPIVIALPRGGVPVAAQVAHLLNAPLDLVLVRKIGMPFQPELAMGAVVDGPTPLTVRNEDIIEIARISEEEFDALRDRELGEINRRRARYLGERSHPELDERVVIVVDDGIATGATTRAALRAVRSRNPKQNILAVPVAPTSTLRELRAEADKIVCLEQHEDFGAIGFYYDYFGQLSDDEVTRTLAECKAKSSTNA